MGLILASTITFKLIGFGEICSNITLFDYPANLMKDASIIQLVLGGLLMGFGSRLSPGCASGLGLCGVARFSTTSIVATTIFMSVGVITATSISYFKIFTPFN